ncbi:hypothetical protein V5F53_17440 [Xanthobacter sp. V4C-4]|uniref:hypothetical protein n=1 Tax=Xanthobacter cornucopiae TaxID=3119924 RepID=UPI003729DE97
MPRRAVLAGLWAGLVLLTAPGALHAQDPIGVLAATGRLGIGTVEAVTGEVRIERDGAPVAAEPGAAVVAGDTVLTQDTGRAVLLLGPSTQVRLGPDTRLRIDRFTQGEGATFTFGGGAMLYTRSERGQPPPVSLTAPFGTLIGRVGRFFVGRVEAQYGVLVMRDSLKVSSGGGVVNLEPGDALDIPRNGLAPGAPQPWSEARIRLALSLVE